MQTLTATLEAAQKSSSAKPYAKVLVRNRRGGSIMLSWTRLYTGAEPASPHAAIIAGDGSLCRARVSGGKLYHQRVVSPAPGSDFSVWTELVAANVAGPIAAAAFGTKVCYVYFGLNIPGDATELYLIESTDYGATFGAPVLVSNIGGGLVFTACSVSYKDSDNLNVFFASTQPMFWSRKRISGVWQAASPNDYGFTSYISIASCYYSDYNLLISASSATRRVIIATCYGDGGSYALDTWSAELGELTVASPSSHIEYRSLSLWRADTFRCSFIEAYSPVAPYVATAYTRHYLSNHIPGKSFNTFLWREPFPFNESSDCPLSFTASATYAWLSIPAGVWRASLTVQEVELTASVIEVRQVVSERDDEMEVVLDNSAGSFTSFDKLGWEIIVSPGYYTTAAAEYITGTSFYIESWSLHTAKGASSAVLYCMGPMRFMGVSFARRSYHWSAASKTIYEILQYLFARSGIELSTISASTPLTTQRPSFTVHPGEALSGGVRRLMSFVEDRLLFRGEKVWVVNPTPPDPTAYTYGSGHAILGSRYATAMVEKSHIQVFGVSGLMVEGFDWAELEKVYNRVKQIYDYNLTTQSQAEARVETELRQSDMDAFDGQLKVLVNCGQEMWDVVQVSDVIAPFSGTRRVSRLSLVYSRIKGEYYHLIQLCQI